MAKRYNNVTPQFLMNIAEPLEDVVRHLEDQMLLNIAKLFHGDPDDWQQPAMQWQARKLAKLGKLNTDNIRLISKYAGQENSMAQIAIERTLGRAIKAVDPDLDAAMRKGYLQGNPGGQDETIHRQLAIYERQAQDRLNMVNTKMLNSSLMQAQRVIANTQAYERRLARAQETLNRRTGEVVTGVSSRQTAVRRAIMDLARDGLTGFVDAAGHEWSPEAYVSMDIRTTAHNAATQAVMDRAREYGCHLVEVSSHAGARPLCEPYQGRIFDLDNGSGEVEDLHGNRLHYSPWSSTSFGEPAGLLGINCGHDIYPFTPGFSVKRFDRTQDKEANDLLYEQRQQQRQIERNIRNYKRMAGLLDAVGDAEGAQAARQKVRMAQEKMRDFISETGLTRRRDREQVYGQ